LHRRLPLTPACLTVGRGLAVGELAPLPRTLVTRLLAHAAATLAGSTANRANATGLERLHFAWAGATTGSGPFYVRLHGEDFAVEWFAREDGSVQGAWRDFAADRGRPWLRDTVAAPEFATTGRPSR
jgi:hypothetical protein